jgi:DNA-binding MarR family transcriptional regulator
VPGGGQQPDGAEYACAQAWTALSAAHSLVTEHLTAALNQACGLSIHEFEVLLRVAHAADGGLRLVALSKMVCLTQPSLSRTVARLERQGWLLRAGAPGDGRGVLVSITGAGREAAARGVAAHAGTIRSLLLDRLTRDEQELLARALTRVATGDPERKEPLWHSQPRSA